MGETAKIDSTDAVCPTTFVTVKDGLEDGEILEIRLNGGEPISECALLQRLKKAAACGS
ncbi:MAG: hypothetical protein LBD29_07655 [Treponema sp.]|jgi:TusA-related sulfurtransferase|nr:hypothetical protein [Treponema sp.]